MADSFAERVGNAVIGDRSGALSSELPMLEWCAVQWLQWCRDYRGRSPETIRVYTNTMGLLCQFVGPRAVGAVTHDDVERFISRRRRGGPPSAATSNRDLSTIRSFYSWCTAKGFVEVSPAVLVHAPTRHRRQPKPIPDGVWQAWWGSELPDGLRLVLGLGFYGGLRRAEIMGLHTRNIQGRKIVDFVRKGGGEHTVPLADMTDILVDRLGGTVGDPQLLWDVLGDSVRRGGWVVKYVVRDPQELNRRINKWSIKSGLPRFTPHQLRHSAASNLVRAGVPLHLTASLLNHSNIQITMGYVSSGGEQLAEWKKSLVNDNKLS